MTHADRILSLPADTLLYNIHTGDRYLREHLKPQWIDHARTKANEVYDTVSGHYVDISFLRVVGHYKPRLTPKIWSDNER